MDANDTMDTAVKNSSSKDEFIKTCPRCGKSGPAAKMFSPHHSSKDGFTNICKDCWAMAIKAGRGKTVEKKKMKNDPKPAGETIVRAIKQERTMEVSLPKNIWEKLMAMATDQLRTPDNMIAYLIFKAESVS